LIEQVALHDLESRIHHARTSFVFEAIITIKIKATTITETYYNHYFRKIRSITQSCVHPLGTNTTTNTEHCNTA
jgi:hypothetical protein